tara:strand:- start:32779 stop:36195 length:3417 start_codon:yes stop_codon:yes gene_type:complete
LLTVEEFRNEEWFKISNSDSLRPFFMSIVSDSNHWMFISSNGGVSAGRKNAEYALFPYYTDDKITESADITGCKTIVQVKKEDEISIWEPFSNRFTGKYSITRNLYKNRWGNKVRFEEINHDLELTFSYEWNSSNEFGFVRRSTLINNAESAVDVSVLDGIQNLIPYGVNSDLQTRVSNLVDAYKRNELAEETGLGMYALSAIIVDKAEPSEALKANVAWSYGLKDPKYLVSSLQVDTFRNGGSVTTETDVKGEKGAYFINQDLSLSAGESVKWNIVGNVNLDHPGVIALNEQIKDGDIATKIDLDIEQGTKNLIRLIASADGLQKTADSFKDARHYSNVMYNIMRGGIFDHHYDIEKGDFSAYLKKANKAVFEAHQSLLESLPEVFDRHELTTRLNETKDKDFIRLAKEYLPLKFSRRHGDPSRPWNRFSINTRSEVDGSKILDYEGNWRDIFQNWEALAHSYPDFMEGMIFKFLNASTFDGYNPYRVTKGGFDWETIEPDDPWSYIGYWGDHQIIYLLKFLEFYQDHKPGAFQSLLNDDVFVYANVPYKIKAYDEIVSNPKDTIDFDHSLDQQIREKVSEMGADGALINGRNNDIHRVNFLEKILATVLSKVSNFIPEGGIWLNTQRPEWNDANNALVGNGVSMVTLYYLRRFLTFFESMLADNTSDKIALSEEVADFLSDISVVLEENAAALSSGIDDSIRKTITDGLGRAGSKFRNRIYSDSFSGRKKEVEIQVVKSMFTLTNRYLEQSIDANRREDELFHAYNLMSVTEEGIEISYLSEMLEGQVAVLSSGYLNAEESLKVLDALRNSKLYREDQSSYILYPNKQLPGFLQRNNIPVELAEGSELIKDLIAKGDRQIVTKDVNGGYHFNGNFKNAGDLSAAMDELQENSDITISETDRKDLLGIFEKVFNHKAFTGRSGTFYGYEGLGSIYWHMVSKLYLAAYEICERADKDGVDDELFARLSKHFHEIGEGIGIHKSPKVYGAFPTDPYSHTPGHRGAQQPGMTGQVKEDIITRFGELGVSTSNGVLSFRPIVLSASEFNSTEEVLKFIDLEGKEVELALPVQSLGFTVCQVPVIYQIKEDSGVEVQFTNGEARLFLGPDLDIKTSEDIFGRTGSVAKIVVSVTADQLVKVN